MATAIRMIGHEDRLSLIDHLDELRTRLIVAGLAFAVAFALCFWQSSTLLHVINAPLEHQTRAQVTAGHGPMGRIWKTEQKLRQLGGTTAASLSILSEPGSGVSTAARAKLVRQERLLRADLKGIPSKPEGYNPTTIGFGEPFTATLTVVFYFALLLSMPVILFELYGFVLPALHPAERRVALPLLSVVPFLFLAGVVFGYYVVLPAAVHFFQNYNSGEFNVLVQGASYYKFAALMLIAMGLIFQVPVAVLGVTRAGIMTPKQLRKGRRYAIVLCALIAAVLPGDLVTMLLETIPLYLLYEASVLLASVLARRRAARERREQSVAAGAVALAGAPAGGAGASSVEGDGAAGGSRGPESGSVGGGGAGAGGSGGEQIDPDVREMLDHIDPDLH